MQTSGEQKRDSGVLFLNMKQSHDHATANTTCVSQADVALGNILT